MNDRPVVIEAALNGGRSRAEHPAVPISPGEAAADAAACFDAGATVAHIHARTPAGRVSFDPAWYVAAIQGIRTAAPGMLVSITSLRPPGTAVDVMVGLLDELARAGALPELMSVNLGHTVEWHRRDRSTTHYPNDFADVCRLLEAAAAHGVTPEYGLMDFGYLSNAVLLRDEGLMPANPWFLVELDSPGYGLGMQVLPATPRTYDLFAEALAEQFPAARWAAHGQGAATFAVVERALERGAHVRVGLEDSVCLPDGSPGQGNLDQVRWAAGAAERQGRRVATVAESRAVIGHASPR